MNQSSDYICKACGRVISSACWSNVERTSEEPLAYGDTNAICPHCGGAIIREADDRLNTVITNETKQPTVMVPPENEYEMRTAIIDILKNLYPTRTGYNGGHLAPVRDPSPDLFFSVLHRLEKENVIEYNDTEIALRLSDKFVRENGVIV